MKTPLSKTSFFQSMFAVMRKELREVMRDRRTMMMALVLSPLLTPLLFMGIGKLGENRAKTELDKVLEVPVVGIQQAPNLMAYLATRGIDMLLQGYLHGRPEPAADWLARWKTSP